MIAAEIARTILDGFDRHYRLFREISAGAKDRFERGDWRAVEEANKTRIQMYDRRVAEGVQRLAERFPELFHDRAHAEGLWPQIKLAYIGLLYQHRQPECAETFFNSVACRVLDRRYYNNEYIFWRPAVSCEHIDAEQPAFRCSYPGSAPLGNTIREVLQGFQLGCPFQDLERDIAFVERAVAERFPGRWERQPDFQVQTLSSLFFRNRSAYLIGRALNGAHEYPFVVPILRDDQGRLYLDAILLGPESIGWLFSLARTYFMVDMEVPSAFVAFLKALMPSRPAFELYTLLGLAKQGKTLFYRDLHQHLRHSSDQFQLAPGTKGMVMLVFTLPSFPYVFKVIRDWFEPPKDTDARTVRDRYLLVKYHERAGRMVDTLEYSDVAFPLHRFEPALLEELLRLCPKSTHREGDQVVIRHLYVERRVVPLDLWLRHADLAHQRTGVFELGQAIKDLARANMFAGDLLPKNFGVTRYGRVVFYDYDEICFLTDCRFRRLPTPQSDDEEMAGEPWFSVGPTDIFPEQFPTFLFSEGHLRDLLVELHGDLADPAFWVGTQERCRSHGSEDVAPYPEELRFAHRFGAT